jgi:hypothetical protein
MVPGVSECTGQITIDNQDGDRPWITLSASTECAERGNEESDTLPDSAEGMDRYVQILELEYDGNSLLYDGSDDLHGNDDDPSTHWDDLDNLNGNGWIDLEDFVQHPLSLVLPGPGEIPLTMRLLFHEAAPNDYQGDECVMTMYIAREGFTVNVSNVTASSATISTAGHIPCTIGIEYGETTEYGLTAPDEDLATSHSVTLGGLAPGTTYHFSVQVVDSQGNPTWSADRTFSTVPPEIEAYLTLPLEGSVATDGSIVFVVPEGLAPGETDEETGIWLSPNGDELVIPFKDSAGRETMFIRATGTVVDGVLQVNKMQLESIEVASDLSALDASLGNVGASFKVDLKTLPLDASVKVTILRSPPEDAQSAFQMMAGEAGQGFTLAYAMVIDKTNLENGTDLGAAWITMSVGKQWAKDQGLDNIRIFHYSNDGTEEILDTIFVGYEGDFAVFEALSPNGLSVFGCAGLAPAVVPAEEEPSEFNWVPVIAGLCGVLAVIGLLLIIVLRGGSSSTSSPEGSE